MFIYWIITIVLMTSAFVLAAISDDPFSKYNEPVDYFRAVCEGLTLLLITIGAMMDIVVLFK